MEIDDDHATMREGFSLVQNILFIGYKKIFPAHQQGNMVEKMWETMQFGFVLIADSGGNSWCPQNISATDQQKWNLKKKFQNRFQSALC